MDLRQEMMTRLGAGERLVDLCREYGISRKTGHKFKERYEAQGLHGLADQTRAPRVIPHRTSPELAELICAERRAHPTWGAHKIKAVMERRGQAMPSHGAIERVIKQAGLVIPRPRRHRYEAKRTMLRTPTAPNDVWSIDYKGQFRLGDRSYCYPLTLSDLASRYLLACEGMAAIADEAARETCHDVFRAYGLPAAIRSDNGVPFASTGLAGLTKLSAYFLCLGIELERIEPGHPEENGSHERMHRTLKAETTRPSRGNILQQQERFDEFVHEFNHQRPHQALGQKTPADVYTVSSRPLPPVLPELNYPTHDDTVKVSRWGDIHIAGLGAFKISKALAGLHVGLREEDDGRWLVSFAHLDLGHFHKGDKSLKPIQPKVPNPPELLQ